MRKKEKIKIRRKPADYILMVFMICMACIFLAPLYFLLVGSFRPSSDLISYGLGLRIDFSRMSLDNYIIAFQYRNGVYLKWYFSSLSIMLMQTVCGLFFSSLVGYGLGMYKFKGRSLFLIMDLVLMMLPFEILILPLYQLVANMRLLDTRFGVVMPLMVAPFMIFFFRQSVIGLPKELADAARIDGCGEFRIYWNIMVPLMRAAFGAMGIFCAMGSWNNVLWPLIVLQSNEKLTLPIGLSSLLTPYGNAYDVLMPGAVLAIVPIMIVFFFFQKSFVSGLTIGSIKG